MLITIDQMLGAPVMSLQTGQPLCRLVQPIVDPYSLRVVAFFVDGPRLDFSPAVVFTEDIREFGRVGAIVDDLDNVMPTDGLVRLNKIIDYDFHLIGIPVIDDLGHKLGKVANYTVDPLNYKIDQLYIKPRFWQSLTITSIIINRRQITKVEPHRITVKAPTVDDKFKAPTINDARQLLNPELDNPFRKRPALNSDERHS